MDVPPSWNLSMVETLPLSPPCGEDWNYMQASSWLVFIKGAFFFQRSFSITPFHEYLHSFCRFLFIATLRSVFCKCAWSSVSRCCNLTLPIMWPTTSHLTRSSTPSWGRRPWWRRAGMTPSALPWSRSCKKVALTLAHIVTECWRGRGYWRCLKKPSLECSAILR